MDTPIVSEAWKGAFFILKVLVEFWTKDTCTEDVVGRRDVVTLSILSIEGTVLFGIDHLVSIPIKEIALRVRFLWCWSFITLH
jgi:hypothetical protein